MWFAKPLSALNAPENAHWERVLEHTRRRGEEVPLSQTLAWGRAIQVVGGRSYAVFSTDDLVGGLLFCSNPHALDGVELECVNGPLLEWQSLDRIQSQLAQFAYAAARLEPRIRSISLRPRWLKGQSQNRLPALPVEVAQTTHATTLKIPLTANAVPEASFTPRLRRTLRHAEKAGVIARSDELTPNTLIEFVVAAQAFGRTRGFSVPPVFWFRTLIESAPATNDLKLKIVSARSPDGDCGCQLLIAMHLGEAHYLFGHQWRSSRTRASLSPAAVAQRFAIRESQSAGMRSYDFNGYLENAPADHPYAGVAVFKAQFGDNLVRYEVPEFKIVL